MVTNCFRLSCVKIVALFHFTIIVILTSTYAERLRIIANNNQVANQARFYENYKQQLLYGDKSIKKRRHLGSMNNTPSAKMKVYLFCKTGFLLEIDNNGRITGTGNTSSVNALLEIQIFGKTLRRVKGVASGRYLSINNRGRLTSTFHQNKNTFLKENDEENAWYSYSSRHHGSHCGADVDSAKGKEWFIAIKENGNLRRPCKTFPGMKATHFLVLRQEKIKNIVEKTPA